MCVICIPGGAVALILVLTLIAFGMTVPIWLADVLALLAEVLAWTVAAWLAVGAVWLYPLVRDAFASRREEPAAPQAPPRSLPAGGRRRVHVERVERVRAALPAAGVRLYPTPRREIRTRADRPGDTAA